MKKGFTLVELLIAIAIMAILTTITVSQFQTAKKKANDVQRKGDLHSLGKALQMHFADYGVFPTIINGTDSNNNGVLTSDEWCPSDTDCEFVDASGYVYMKVLPKESRASHPSYCYVLNTEGDRKGFGIFAQLENTEDKECKMDGNQGLYDVCGNHYCYVNLSPNAKVTDGNNGVEVL